MVEDDVVGTWEETFVARCCTCGYIRPPVCSARLFGVWRVILVLLLCMNTGFLFAQNDDSTVCLRDLHPDKHTAAPVERWSGHEKDAWKITPACSNAITTMSISVADACTLWMNNSAGFSPCVCIARVSWTQFHGYDILRALTNLVPGIFFFFIILQGYCTEAKQMFCPPLLKDGTLRRPTRLTHFGIAVMSFLSIVYGTENYLWGAPSDIIQGAQYGKLLFFVPFYFVVNLVGAWLTGILVQIRNVDALAIRLLRCTISAGAIPVWQHHTLST